MFFKIYKTTNLVNGKIYIGQTHYDKPNYYGSGNLILQALEKYGLEKFTKEYIDEASSQEELDKKERFWIKEMDSQNKEIGYNIADGGWNCLTMNDDIKAKISSTLKGKYVGENSFRKGVPLTEEHKKALSVANKGKTLSDEHKEKLSKAHTGKKQSDETKRKLSESHTGKTLSEDHKKKIGEGIKGRTYTDEQKERLKASNIGKTQKHSRTVSALCIQTNIVFQFNNISDAARKLNTTRFKINNNTVEGWRINVNDPLISITDLKKTTHGSESENHTR